MNRGAFAAHPGLRQIFSLFDPGEIAGGKPLGGCLANALQARFVNGVARPAFFSSSTKVRLPPWAV